MAEEYRVRIGAELDLSDFDKIKQQIQNTQISPIKINADSNNIKREIGALKKQVDRLGEFTVRINGGRDITSTIEKFKELKNIQNQLSQKATKLSSLDTTKDVNQIKQLKSQIETLRSEYRNIFNLNKGNFSDSQLNNLSRGYDNLLSKLRVIDSAMSDTTNENKKKQSIKSVADAFQQLIQVGNKINKLELKIKGLDDGRNKQEIESLELELKGLQDIYQTLQGQVNGNLNNKQLVKLNLDTVEANAKIQQIEAKIQDVKNKMAQDIEIKIDNKEIDSTFTSIQASYEKLSSKTDELTNDYAELKEAIESVKNADSVDSRISAYQRYEQAVEKVTNQIKIQATEEKQQADKSRLAQAQQQFYLDTELWLKRNSKASKDFGAQIKDLQAKIKNCDATQLKNLQGEFKRIQTEAAQAGSLGLSTFDRFNEKLKQLTTYFSISTLFFKAYQTARQMYQNVLEVDTAMTELYRVTDLSKQKYEQLYESMTKSAKEYGATLSDIIESTASWVRLGFSADNSRELAEITAMYQHVTDLDNETAVNNLVTAYKGFQEQLLKLYAGDQTKAIEYCADVFDRLGNKYAVTAQDVGNGLTKCASALELAGNSLQESSGMITGISEITRDSDKAGSSLKVLSLRLRGMKGQLQELGEEVDSNIDSVSKMQTQILNLTNGKVNIFNPDKSFKSTYEIMGEIAKEYNNLSDTAQADLLETIAGKNRANDVAALIQNWEQVEKATQDAIDAEGTAREENEKYMDSLQGHINTLKASWQSLSNTFLKSNFLKGLFDAGTKILNVIDSIIKAIGSVPTIIAGYGITKSIYSVIGTLSAAGGLSKLSDTVSLLQLAFPTLTKSISVFNKVVGDGGSKIMGLFKAVGTFVAGHPIAVALFGVAAAVKIIDEAIVTSEEANQKMKDSRKEYEEAQQQIDETNNRLKITQDRIKELEEQGHLTFVEQSELQNLQTLNSELKLALETEKQRAEIKAKETINNTVDAYKKNFKYNGISEDDINQYYNKGINVSLLTNDEDNLPSFLAGYRQAKDLLKEYEDNGSKDDIEWQLGFLDDLKLELLDKVELLQTYQENLEAIPYDKLTDTQKGVLQQVKDSIEVIYKEINPEEWNNIQFDSVISDNSDNGKFLKKQKDDAVEAAKGYGELGISVDELKDKFPDLVSACEDVGISADELAEHINGLAFDSTEKILNLKEKIESLKGAFSSNLQASGDDYYTVNEESSKFDNWIDSLSDEDKSIVYDISVNADDTTLWSLTRWQEEFFKVKISADNSSDSLKAFYDLLNNSESGNFSDTIDAYVKKVDTLQDVLDKIDTGQLTEKDKISLVTDFPQLANATSDTNNLRNAIKDLLDVINDGMDDTFESQLENFGGASTEAGKALLKLKDLVDSLSKDKWDIDIDKETQKLSNLYSAMKESVSGTGLSSTGIKNVTAMFSDLDGYDPSKLFERTANGIHLNVTELRKLQEEYKNTKKQDILNHVESLKEQYNNLSTEIALCTDVKERENKQNQLDALQEEITNVTNLASQYEGLTSSYNAWILAQSAGNERDMYESIGSGKSTVEDLINRGWIDDAVRSYVSLVSSANLANASAEEVVNAYNKTKDTIGDTGHSIWDYFTFDEDNKTVSDGIFVFFDDVQKELGDTYACIDESGNHVFNFGDGKDAEVAEKFGMNVETLQSILRAASDAGFDVKLDSPLSDLDKLVNKAEDATGAIQKLKELGKIDVDFTIDDTDITNVGDKITQAQKALDTFRNTDGTINTNIEGAEEAQELLINLIVQKQKLSEPDILKVDTSDADSKIKNVITLLKDFQDNYNTNELQTSVGIDTTDTQTKIQGVVDKLNSISDDKKVALGLDDESFQNAVKNIEETNITAGATINQEDLDTIQSKIENITPEMMVNIGIDPSLVEDFQKDEHEAEGTLTWKNDDTRIKQFIQQTHNATGSVIWGNNTSGVQKSFVANGIINWRGSSKANGTAHSNGTAYSGGSWGLQQDVDGALVGEQNPEILVRDGQYYILGQDGAEIVNGLRKNDIIFNAQQSEQILKYGKITSGNKRGKTFSSGTAFSSGSGGWKRPNYGTSTTTSSTSASSSGSSGSGSSKSSSSSSSSSASEAKDFKETLDWIEIAISRIERGITNLDNLASSTFKDWSSRNKNLKLQIEQVGNEINLQSQAYQRYMQQANSVGLSEEWARKVRNGEVDINTITDEDLNDKISEYQQWHEKALACQDAIFELQNTEGELYKTSFDNVSTEYESIISLIEHQKSMLNEQINQSEEKGYIVSTKYYDALIQMERDNIVKLKEEKARLESALKNSLDSGAITKDSEAFYEMTSQINDVSLSLEEANTNVITLNNSIRQIKWDVFDMLQDKISYITDEADYLIKLMENDKLFDDKGSFTDEGLATVGLHGMNYNVYMEQSKKYKDEMLRINAELAKDPNNQDLIKRKQELIELQHETILAANEEKQAIVDVVSQGIKIELDALKDLISTYKDAQKSQKDLYDYQKKVKEQTKEIATLQKQLSAYAGDDSEETKQKIQKIQVSLENAQENLQETEYDKYLSDQEKLLDDLYDEYEDILNQRLDNVDALIQEMIDKINLNSDNIMATLIEQSNEVGSVLSSELTSVWNNNTGAVTDVLKTYGDSIKDSLSSNTTTVTTMLNGIAVNLQSVVMSLNEDASQNISSSSNSSSSSSATSSSSSSPTPSSPTPSSSSSGASSSSSTKAWGSWFVYKKDSYPKNKLNVNTSVVDRLKFFDIDSDMSRRATYYYAMGGTGTYTGTAQQNTWIISQMKSHGYKNGVYNYRSNDNAWTQENGKEAIIRPSDGAILTPLTKGDSVLTADATRNMFDFFNNPYKFIMDSNIGNIPNSLSGLECNNTFDIDINLEGIKNYEDFKYAMQHDKNFEKMIRSMTVDRMFGGSSLKKYNC